MVDSIQNNSERMETGTDKTRHSKWINEEYEPGLVSVIIPTYNRAQYLFEAMESVFQQTYRPIELIVVDDGSTDNTDRIVEGFNKRAANGISIGYIIQPKTGACAARNRGLVESRGEFINFLDSDDLLLPEKLSRQLDMLHHHDFDYIVCRLGIFCDDPARWIPQRNTSDAHYTLIQYIKHPSITTSTVLMKRHVARQVGPWDESLLKWQDWEYFARFFLHDFTGFWHKDILSLWRQHDDGSITNLPIVLTCDSMLEACYRVMEGLDLASTVLRKQVRSAIGCRILSIANSLAIANEKHTSWKYVTIAHPLLTMEDRIRCYPGYLMRILAPHPIQNVCRYMKRRFRAAIKQHPSLYGKSDYANDMREPYIES